MGLVQQGTRLKCECMQPDYSRGYQRLVLIMAFLVIMVSLMDRYVVSILMEQIKTDLSLTDTQLGWLVGPAFVVVHVLSQLPLARMADTLNRRNMIASAMAIWSLFTVAAGFAKTFPQLLITRMGVGVSEAACTPALVSLLSDYFPPERRAKAMSVITVGSVAGIGAGMLFGGFLGQQYGWRVALMLAGVPGVLLAIALMLLIREPARSQGDADGNNEAVSLKHVVQVLWKKGSFRWLIVGAACLHVVMLGRGVWEPVFLIRSYGMEQSQAGLTYFFISPLAAVFGGITGGILADRLCKRDLRWGLWLPAAAMLVTFPLSVTFLLMPTDLGVAQLGFPLAFVFSAVGSFTAGMGSPAAIAAAQNIVSSSMRATTHAIWSMAANLVGMGSGPLMVGLLSDYWQPALGNESLRYALVAVSGFALLSAWGFWRGGNIFNRDVVVSMESTAPAAKA